MFLTITIMTIENSNRIHITVRPTKLTPSGQRYEARCGEDMIATSRTPFLAAARVLIERGHSSDTVLTMSHEGDDTVALRSTLGAAAGLRVVENDTAGPRFGRYIPPPAERPFPVDKGRTKTASFTVPGRDAHAGADLPLARVQALLPLIGRSGCMLT